LRVFSAPCPAVRPPPCGSLRAEQQAHKLSRRPAPASAPVPPPGSAEQQQGRHTGEPSLSPLLATTSAAAMKTPASGRGIGPAPTTAPAASGPHRRSRSGSGLSIGSGEGLYPGSSGAAGAAASGTYGNWGGQVGKGLPRGREVKRLAKKMRALMRDCSPSSSLEAFQVEEARLRLWVSECGTGQARTLRAVFSFLRRGCLCASSRATGQRGNGSK